LIHPQLFMNVVLPQIFISPGHNFFGRPRAPAGEHPTREVATVICRAGWGIEGDRFYGYRPGYKGQITFFAADVFEALKAEFRLPGISAGVLRRNVLIGGADLTALIGKKFSISGVAFEGTGEARPCHWMNHAVAPGAEDWLKGRGGLRARVLSDGELQTGAAELLFLDKSPEPLGTAGVIGKCAVELRLESGG
jgi:MOSC domain-containing protein YiiM